MSTHFKQSAHHMDYLDLAYARSSESQKLDLYLPHDYPGPYPLLILVHGGAFMGGDKRGCVLYPSTLATQALQQGYALASLNYRLSGEALFPACIQDVKTAVRWLRTHAAEYRLDTERFAAWGDSAGGYLVAILGISAGIPELEGADQGNDKVSSQVQAVIDWYGPIDFLTMDIQLAELGLAPPPGEEHDGPDSPESRLMGFPIQEAPEKVQAANPMTYLGRVLTPPPFLIFHGSRDHLIAVQQSQNLAAALLPYLGADRLILDDSMPVDHGGEPDFFLPGNRERMLRFLDRSLNIHRG
jgi:acetyl esterase/lipase